MHWACTGRKLDALWLTARRVIALRSRPGRTGHGETGERRRRTNRARTAHKIKRRGLRGEKGRGRRGSQRGVLAASIGLGTRWPDGGNRRRWTPARRGRPAERRRRRGGAGLRLRVLGDARKGRDEDLVGGDARQAEAAANSGASAPDHGGTGERNWGRRESECGAREREWRGG